MTFDDPQPDQVPPAEPATTAMPPSPGTPPWSPPPYQQPGADGTPPPPPGTYPPGYPPQTYPPYDPGYPPPGAQPQAPGYPPPGYGQYPTGYGPYGPGYGYQIDHPQGTLILIFGILGLVTCQLLGVAAWVMGNKALKEIDADPARYRNRSNVQAGRICGMVSVGLLLFFLTMYALFFLVIALGAASN